MSRFVDFKAVKAAVNMLQVLEHYGVAESFKHKGNSLSGPCPLHQGQNRTQFRVSLDKNCWHCFGACNDGGNVLDFVARMESVSLREAALLLCDWFQLPTQEQPRVRENPDERPPKAESRPAAKPGRKLDANLPGENEPNKPLGFALQNLDSAHPYLAERGLSEETIAEFGLGYCQKGSMTGRIVIPIHNVEGQLVAYAGRWPSTPPDEDTPKYKLPPGFRRAQEVFNFHRTLRESDEAPLFIVKGFFGCMKLWQHGCRRVVALMDCSLSIAQEELLTRATTQRTRALLMLGEDDAARTAQLEILTRLAAKMFVKVYHFAHEGQQPDSLNEEQLAALELF